MSAREKILEAADELFGEVGFDAATTRQIAELSGVNKALIHYHFDTKDALFHSVLDRYYERLGEALRGALGGEGALPDRLYRLIDTYVDFLRANGNFSRMVQREASGGRHLERIVSHMVPIFRVGSELIERAYPAAAGGELSASQLLISFYGMVVSTFTYAPVVEGLFGVDPLSDRMLALRKRHLRRMLDLVVRALEAQRGEEPGEDRTMIEKEMEENER